MGASAQPERTEPTVSRVSSLEPAIRQFDGKRGLSAYAAPPRSRRTPWPTFLDIQ